MLNGVIGPPPGRYILGLSGGLDSVTLLDVLVKDNNLELVAAHYNHNMRPDSDKDEELASNLADRYGVEFEVDRSMPGLLKSEDAARRARYKFFKRVQEKHKAISAITAHHQDDLIETALINILRGTNRKGLSAISSNPNVLRPLINASKKQIRFYAKKHQLTWVEDPTNMQNNYLRNYIRNQILTRLNDRQRDELVDNLQKVAKNNIEADRLIATISRKFIKDNAIERIMFINLPLKVGNELVASWFRQNSYRSYNQKTLGQTANVIKTAKPGTLHKVNSRLELLITKSRASLRVTDGDA